MNHLSMIYNVSLIYLMLCGLKFVLMSPQLVAKAKTVKLREVGLIPSILPGTISNTQGLPPDRGLPCSCAAQWQLREAQYYTVGQSNTDREKYFNLQFMNSAS